MTYRVANIVAPRARDLVGRRVQLLIDMTNRRGDTFAAGTELEIIHVWKRRLHLATLATPRQIITGVSGFDVVLLPATPVKP